MPFKSHAQRKKFASMVKSGEMSQAEYDEWERDTPAQLPKRIGPKKPGKITSLKQLRKVAEKKTRE